MSSLPCQAPAPALQHNAAFQDKLHLGCRDLSRKAAFCQGRQGAARQDKMTLPLELLGRTSLMYFWGYANIWEKNVI